MRYAVPAGSRDSLVSGLARAAAAVLLARAVGCDSGPAHPYPEQVVERHVAGCVLAGSTAAFCESTSNRTRLIADVVTGKLDVREAAELLPDQEVGDDWLEDGPPADCLKDDIPEAPAEGLAIESEVAR